MKRHISHNTDSKLSICRGYAISLPRVLCLSPSDMIWIPSKKFSDISLKNVTQPFLALMSTRMLYDNNDSYSLGCSEDQMKVKVAQSCPTLCDLMDYRVHGILQGRIQEWIVFPFSRRSSQARDWTQVSHIAGGFFNNWAAREAHKHVLLPLFNRWGNYFKFRVMTFMSL